MRNPRKRQKKLRIEPCEPRLLLTTAPVAVSDVYSLVEDTPLILATSDQDFIELESIWRYLDDGSDQGTAWQTLAFNDNSWNQGQAELGYGDGDELTVVEFGGDPDNKFPTTYFRHEFNVSNPQQVAELFAEVRFDDGVAVYLNGTEIVRDNVGPNATFDQFALGNRSNES